MTLAYEAVSPRLFFHGHHHVADIDYRTGDRRIASLDKEARAHLASPSSTSKLLNPSGLSGDSAVDVRSRTGQVWGKVSGRTGGKPRQ